MIQEGEKGVRRVLFVTWDGPHSTYLTGLFLPIFRALAEHGIRFDILQFGWGGAEEVAALASTCAESGVRYRRVPVWRRPVAAGSVLSALAGRYAVRRAVREWAIDLLMPRSYLPALASIGTRGWSGRRLPLLLDADGLPNDERLEFRGGSAGLTHRLLAVLERLVLRSADIVTVRTESAAEILCVRAGGHLPRNRFRIVANARDSRIFAPASDAARSAMRKSLGIADDAPLLVFAGTALHGKYLGGLTRDVLRQLRVRRPDARLLLIMPDASESKALMQQEPELSEATIHVSAAPEAVPALIGAADLGLSPIRATPSMKAASAVKTGEYLLCGVPVLATAGVGGVERILTPDSGRCLTGDDPAELTAATDWFVDSVLADRARFRLGARQVGLAHYALDAAIPAYESAIRAALARDDQR